MNEPILVIDVGSSKTAAILVTGDVKRLLREPFSGLDSWPTSVALEGDAVLVGTVAEGAKNGDPGLYSGRFLRALGSNDEVTLGDRTFVVPDLITALFDKLRAEAERLTGGSVTRMLLTMDGDNARPAPLPAARSAATVRVDRPRWQVALRDEIVDMRNSFRPPDMGHASSADPATPDQGNPSAQQVMIAAATAAGFTDFEFVPAAAAVTLGAEPAAGRAYVLVCDVGASSARISLVETGDGFGRTLAAKSVDDCGGDLFDDVLASAIRADAGNWLAPRLDAEGINGERSRLRFADFIRRLRHQLTDAEETEDYFGLLDPLVRFARADLERLLEPSLRKLVRGCRDVLAQAHVQPGDLADVLLAGGCARTPALVRAVSTALGRDVAAMTDPQLACVTGGSQWAARASSRRIPALGSLPGVRALAWHIEDGAARLDEWLVPVGARFGAGESLAMLRDGDDALWDLTAELPGTMRRHCARAKTDVTSGEVLAVVQLQVNSPAELTDPPECVGRLPGSFVSFNPHDQQAVTMDGSGRLRVWDLKSTAEISTHTFRRPLAAGQYDVALISGGWLVAYVGSSGLEIRDMATGRHLEWLASASKPWTVRFSADGERVCMAESRRVRVWYTDGQRLLSIREPVLGADPAAAVAFSRDGRWLAIASDTQLRVWDVEHNEMVSALPLPTIQNRMWKMTLSPYGNRILLVFDSSMEMIDLASGEHMWRANLKDAALGADFTPDGKFLATVSFGEDSCSASVVTAADGKLLHTVVLDEAYDSVRISPDGLLMAISNDSTSVIWALAG